MLELSSLLSDSNSSRSDRSSAEGILEALSQPPHLGKKDRASAILLHATGNYPAHSEIDVSLIYADYYFIEAILRDRGLMRE
jgi:unsaturated chondroitin disaccharide hydrolase